MCIFPFLGFDRFYNVNFRFEDANQATAVQSIKKSARMLRGCGLPSTKE